MDSERIQACKDVLSACAYNIPVLPHDACQKLNPVRKLPFQNVRPGHPAVHLARADHSRTRCEFHIIKNSIVIERC